MSKTKSKRTFKDFLKLFFDDKLSSNYLYYNLKAEDRERFRDKVYKHPNKYLRGRNLSEKQIKLLKESFWTVRCKREDCEFYHPSFHDCSECIIAEKQNKFITFKKNTSDVLECAVCISSIEKNESCAILECNHSFHNECILKWLKKHLNCPCCRENFNKYMI